VNEMATRNNKLTIRLTPEEYKYFLAVQRNSGMSQADFLMKAVDEMFIKSKTQPSAAVNEHQNGN
jgi:hypothetical protein